MNHWLDDLARIQARRQWAISVAVASTRGSAPRESGTRMQVTSDEIFGTIGGGNLEFKAIQIARDLLAAGGVSMIRRFPLGASLGQCCGGLVNLLFEPVAPDAQWVNDALQFRQQGRDCTVITQVRGSVSTGKLLVADNEYSGSLGTEMLDREAMAIARQRIGTDRSPTLLGLAGEAYFVEPILAPDFHVALFGAGHVGRAIVKILADLPCRITWIDSRDAEFPTEVPRGVEKIVSEFPQDEVARACAGSYFLVMTHSHQLDQAICERILLLDDFAYFGLIGSLSKRRQFERRWLARGIPATRLAQMTCPIGAGGIASKEPMAIAVSVAAELLRRRSTGKTTLISSLPRAESAGVPPPRAASAVTR